MFLGGASIVGGALPVVLITRLVDGPAGLTALRRRLLQTRASIGWYALTLLAVPLVPTGGELAGVEFVRHGVACPGTST